MKFTLEPIGKVKSDLKEKFGTPKQSQMTSLISYIQIDKHIPMEAFDDLSEMSHIWIIFFFHLNEQKVSAMVRPPLLGGNKKVGIYSSRSSFRHNNLGLSLVRLKNIDIQNRCLEVEGLDCVNGTPVLDIKPFHPTADIPNGQLQYGWIEQTLRTPLLKVEFSLDLKAELKNEIEQILQRDPRPSYHSDQDRIYGIHYKSYNVLWKIKDEQTVVVLKVESI